MSDDSVLTVNGAKRSISLAPERSLLHLLREEMGLTGAKYGCGEGACGACTVLVDGTPARACVVPLRDAADRDVITIEGLSPSGALHPVQQAFLDLNAFQCGFCTPGMILGAIALLRANPQPDERAIATALEGHLCRCCTYPRIVRAVRRAAELTRSAP